VQPIGGLSGFGAKRETRRPASVAWAPKPPGAPTLSDTTESDPIA